MARAATIGTRGRKAAAPSTYAKPDVQLVQVPHAFDPAEVDLHPGTHKFRHDPLESPHRQLVDAHDGINGHPLDWARATDPSLADTLVAVRTNPEAIGPPAWFDAAHRWREETFHSPLSGRFWSPDTRLVRRLLHLTPYVIVRRIDDTIQYAFDVRTIEDPHDAARTLRDMPPDTILPASGAFATAETELDAMCIHVPFTGDRFARSTRKRFRLATPGLPGDATVESVAARVLAAHGYFVESPRVLVACYRLLVGEPVASWWRTPLAIELRGDHQHHPPGANPLEGLLRGLAACADIAAGSAPDNLRALGDTLIRSGKRPPSYVRYTERLAHFAETFGGPALAACFEGTLLGHRATHADLLLAHPRTRQSALVEVKSRGDRIRPTQVESALWHARTGRCGYRIMKVDHPKT